MPVWQATMLGRMRELLKDTVGPYLWPDAVLRLCLDDAIVDYSQEFPRPYRVVATTTAGQTQFDVETAVTGPGYTDDQRQVLTVTRVECPPRRVLRQTGFTPTLPGAEGRAVQQTYYTVGPVIYFRQALDGAEVGSNLLVVYGTAVWQRFTVDSADPAKGWNLPGPDQALVLLMAVRHAWRHLALQGLKAAPYDVDPGDAVRELDAILGAQLRTRRRRPRSYRLGVD
jgi:hypothetical protein